MGANCNRPPDSRCAFEPCVRGELNQPRAVRRITYEHERRPVASRQKEQRRRQKTRARRPILPDVDSHAAADDDTRASTKAGTSSQGASDVLFANLESAASNPVEPPLPISSELCFGMNSGATPAPTSGYDGAFRSRDSCRSASAAALSLL